MGTQIGVGNVLGWPLTNGRSAKEAPWRVQLRFIKHYRTPVSLRAFARIFILILPILYGPYYADLANSTNIGFSSAFSVAISMALQGLFTMRMGLEDPFVQLSESPDAVDVDRELADLEMDLAIFLGSADEAEAAAAAMEEAPAGGTV